MFCPKCGKELRDGAAFCNGCGIALDSTTPPNDLKTKTAKKSNWFIITALVSIGGLYILGSIYMLFSRIYFGNVSSESCKDFGIVICAITFIALIIDAVLLKKTKSPSRTFICNIIVEAFLFILLLVFANQVAQSFGTESIAMFAYPARAFGIAMIIPTIVAALLGKFLQKKNVIPNVIILLILFFASLIVFFLSSKLFGIANLGVGLGLAIFQPFAVFLPCSLKEKDTMVVKQNNQSHVDYKTMFCPNCGNRFPAGKKFCDQCGNELKETLVSNDTAYFQNNPQDVKSTGFGVLGFFFPVIGLILYLVWKDTMPLKAKSAGKGALVGAITGVTLTILIYVIYFIILASLF